MKFLDLFAGIGGFRLGMESADHECIGFCEIDKFARASYKAIHNTEGEIELHDITTVTDDDVRAIGAVDVICGGFPCQAFSFKTIVGALDELGYDIEWQVLNSKNFGVPQNRERVFIIGHLRGERTRNVFPIVKENAKSDNQQPKIEIVGNTKNPKQVAIPNKIKQFGIIQPNYNQSGIVYDTDGIAPTIRAYQGGNLEPKIRVREATKQGYAEATIGDSVNLSHPNSKTRRGRVGKQITNTLLTGESQGVVEPDFRIRKLTPRECWRLQGFPDWAFDKAQEVNSNSQLYKQAGNSVTVNVIAAIAERL